MIDNGSQGRLRLWPSDIGIPAGTSPGQQGDGGRNRPRPLESRAGPALISRLSAPPFTSPTARAVSLDKVLANQHGALAPHDAVNRVRNGRRNLNPNGPWDDA